MQSSQVDKWNLIKKRKKRIWNRSFLWLFSMVWTKMEIYYEKVLNVSKALKHSCTALPEDRKRSLTAGRYIGSFCCKGYKKFLKLKGLKSHRDCYFKWGCSLRETKEPENVRQLNTSDSCKTWYVIKNTHSLSPYTRLLLESDWLEGVHECIVIVLV